MNQLRTHRKTLPEDLPFTSEEDFDEIQWPKKQEYQQLLDKYKDKEVGSVKLLKKGDDNILIKPSQQEVLTVESHPLPQDNTLELYREQQRLKRKNIKREIRYGCGTLRKVSLTTLKGMHNFGLDLSELE
jgi:hypothetical protein